MKLNILYLPLFILIYSFYSLQINPGFPVTERLNYRIGSMVTAMGR